MKKTVWTLNIGQYAPQITELTFPLMRYWARKIGADFKVITVRKFPNYPIPYEKLQLHELGQDSDWNLFLDADALVHPESIDFTNYIKKDTVVHNGTDVASVRWRYDNYLLRDGRNIGSCNWCTFASDWCLDIWKPLDDLSLEEAVANIFPTVQEQNSGVIEADHLLDDYVLSRNIARFGLKVKRIPEIWESAGLPGAWGFFHLYTDPIERKVHELRRMICTRSAQPGEDPKNADGSANLYGWGIGQLYCNLVGYKPDWMYSTTIEPVSSKQNLGLVVKAELALT